MATTGVFNGTNLLLKVGPSGSEVALGHTTSCSISISQDLPDATTKDSAGWNEVIAGARGGSISFDGLVAYDDAANFVELMDYVIGRTKIAFIFGTEASQETIYTGEGYIESLEKSADSESPVAYSGSITITGAITKSANPL